MPRRPTSGIIENHEVLREQLKGQGYVFTSDTDTEVIAQADHQRAATAGGDQAVGLAGADHGQASGPRVSPSNSH